MGESRIFRFYNTASMVVVALLAFVILLATREAFWPSDWVAVTVRNVPEGISQIYLIADRSEVAQVLHWYTSKVAPLTHDPRVEGMFWEATGSTDQRRADVRWLRADRYGALAQRADGSWRIWWLGPGELVGPPASRYIWGGGTAKIRLPDESSASVPTKEILAQIGLPDTAD